MLYCNMHYDAASSEQPTEFSHAFAFVDEAA